MKLHGGPLDGEEVDADADGVIVTDTDLETGIEVQTHYRKDTWGRMTPITPTDPEEEHHGHL